MFRTDLEDKISDYVNENVTDEMIKDIKAKVIDVLDEYYDDADLIELVIAKNLISDALEFAIIDTAMQEDVVTAEDLKQAQDTTPFDELMQEIERTLDSIKEEEEEDDDEDGVPVA